MKEDYTKKLILGVLVLSSVVLGVLIYNKDSKNFIEDNTSNSEVSPIIDKNIFSEEEIKLLNPPRPGSSRQETEEHSKLAAKLAVVGDEINIKDCKAGPIVLQAKFGSNIKFKNSSSYDISISFDEKNVLDIGSGLTVSTSKPFVYGIGLYGYLCKSQNFSGLVGFILLTP